MSKSSCDCPNPPGGKVVCEPNQMAVCRIKNGEIIQRCLNPISTIDSMELVQWALEEITDAKLLYSEVTNKELLTLLKGEFTDENQSVKFNLPESVSQAVVNIMREGGNNMLGFERENEIS